ncbi:N-acyl homoserine lactonase family protein [Sulfitobacter sp. D35]|uniref:N-acyl homoserine lactonase family protein n=1 Tax=Sulfitobacter sp. D35 TaxID=3083252 RepID=UPI00296EF4BB|nr:N-acyl homoserine lactonase family protein [Sulfitobacter sp. D35]MDW4499169.1 N-acyl homoserine lactonase family protein [Sulfitobacter sp. D35]
MEDWQVYAVRYAERNERTRADSFLFDASHDTPHPMDYYVWVLRRGGETILVDTGYDRAEGATRGRPILMEPAEALAPLGITPDRISSIIVTHLHYDHAGGLHLFPNATLHLQAAEMAYATGPCMCHDALRHPYTGEHICEAVRRLHRGQVIFHDGDAEIAEGVSLHRIGGHSRGLQAVRVRCAAGWLCLASDAAHFYENFLENRLFPIVVDAEHMLQGFSTIQRLATSPQLVVPGHDPLVRHAFPQADHADHIFRLDNGPAKRLF